MRIIPKVSLFLALVLLLTGCHTSAEPADDGPVTYYTRTNANKETAPDNDMVLAEIEARSGIKLNVVAISNESYGERINMMIAANDVFDGFNLVGASGVTIANLLERDAIQPVNDLVEQYGMNIQNVMGPAFEYLGTDPDGNYWSLPRSESFPMGFVPTIRKDWLDALDMDMPTTMSELEAFFDAVLANDLNGNGDPTDEIPFLGDSFLYGISNFSPYFFGTGITSLADQQISRHYLAEDGTVHIIYEHPNFKHFLETFARWYEKGYMHVEANTLTTTQSADLRNANRVACTAGWYSTGVGAELTLREEGVTDALYVALPPLTDVPEGGVIAWPSNPVYDQQTVIMKNAEHADKLIQYYDWMVSSPENLALVAYGIEGVHWNWYDKEANIIELTSNASNYSGYYSLGNMYYYPQMPTVHITPDAARDYENDVLQKDIRNTMITIPAFDATVSYSYDGTEAESLSGDGITMVEEAITRIILGQMPVDEWDHVIAEYKALEGDIYSAIWTEQYNAAKGT